ncbi:bifunctional DNA primase/polymerase [Syntrophorhabdus aromaticivorans]|uniref:bifunctional DNA primase/polymerase n=1 Tax=Syntrophorhabdus aromaticivorans TaxID=328301 RepID=UPI00048AD76F|nr:bifunctional DNA primase/polymerase [Syntrophorhabdus aromaticivorans]
MTETPLKTAYLYRRCGFSLIPVSMHKRPVIATWEPYQRRFPTDEELKGWFGRKQANIALVTGEISNLLVVDGDEYKHPGICREIEVRLGDAPCPVQTTPRGGKHYLFSHERGFTNKSDYTDGLDIRTTGGYIVVAPSQNAEGKTWAWVEGRSPIEIPLTPMPEPLRAWLKELDNASKPTRVQATGAAEWFKDGRRDNDLFTVANSLTRGGADPALVEDVLTRLVNSWGEHDSKWIQSKVDSALKRADKRETSVAKDVREWVVTTSGNFLTTECHKDLGLTTRGHKKAATMAFLRLEKEGVIARCGLKNGSYRLIEHDDTTIDYLNADPDDYLRFKFPLGLERKTRIFPKSIIILAGVTGMGKTTYLLDFIQQNMNTYKITYHNSEMSPQALNFKLRQFNRTGTFPLSAWNFTARHWRGTPDAIDPNGVNIVDFLQAGSNAWEIQQPISQILEKLNRGVALIAIQKKPGATYGTGGVYSAMDASLVISMEWQEAVVTKNRFREVDEFPGKDSRGFAVRYGHIEPLSGWYPAEKKAKGFSREKGAGEKKTSEAETDKEDGVTEWHC